MPEALATLLGNIEILQLLAVWLVVVVAAVMRSFTGFGFALTAVPAFSLMMPPTEAVVLSAALSLVVSLLALPTYWGKYPLRKLLPMLGAGLVGTAVGASLLLTISREQFQLWIGLSVILACGVLSLYRPSHHHRGGPFWSGLTGLVSGLMNGAFAIPGPPVIIYAVATQSQPERSRALMMTFFLFSAVLALGSYGVAGFVSTDSPWLFLLALPALYLGDRLGYWMFRRYGSAVYRRVAIVVLFGLGVVICFRALG